MGHLAKIISLCFCVFAYAGLYRNMTPIKVTAGGTPFVPSDLTGKILLFIAAPGNVTLGGSNVEQWNDLSGNGSNATAVGNFPTYDSAVINGKDAINFSALGVLGQALSITNTTILQAARGSSIYIIYKHNALTVGSAGNIFFSFKLDSSANFPVFGYDIATTMYFFSGKSSDVSAPAAWTIIADTNWHTGAFIYNGSGYGTASNSSMYYDKVLQSTVSFGVEQYGSNNTIASYTAGGGATFSFYGDIAFFVVVDHAFSGTELTNLNNWALSQYAL